MTNSVHCTGVVVVVARVEGAVPSLLFLRRAGGRYDRQWWPVTGTFEPSEPPLAGALRELEEETSLHSEAVYETGLTAADVVGLGILKVFVAIVHSRLEVSLNWEHEAQRWCSLSEALDLIASVGHPYLVEAERIARARPRERQIFPEPSARGSQAHRPDQAAADEDHDAEGPERDVVETRLVVDGPDEVQREQ